MKTGDQIVQDLPWKWRVQGRIFIIGGLGYLFDAWDVALNGFLTPLLGTEFDLSVGERSLVATANLIGMAAGAVAWGSVADRIGRKKAFSTTLLVFAVFSVLAAFSPPTAPSCCCASSQASVSVAASPSTTRSSASSHHADTAAAS